MDSSGEENWSEAFVITKPHGSTEVRVPFLQPTTESIDSKRSPHKRQPIMKTLQCLGLLTFLTFILLILNMNMNNAKKMVSPEKVKKKL